MKNIFQLSTMLATLISSASVAFAAPLTNRCTAYQLDASGSTQVIELSPSTSANGELNFTGSTKGYKFTVIFQPTAYNAYWALIEKLPDFKPAIHSEGSFRAKTNPAEGRHMVLQTYDGTNDIKLECEKR